MTDGKEVREVDSVRTTMTPAQKEYAAREQRILDAIALRTPDRLPAVLFGHFWAGRCAGS